MTSEQDLPRLLQDLFDAERAARRVHAQVTDAEPFMLLPVLEQGVREALALDDEAESALRLVRLSALLGELEGPQAVDLLVDILGCEEPEARHAAGEALEDLAYDRFKEVALGVERALERLPAGSLALAELPYLLADIPEPGVLKLLERFLGHEDAEAVAAAIEALVEYGDPAAASMLARLERDKRTVTLEDDEGEEGKVTLAELANEARQLVAGFEGEEEPTGRRPGGGRG